ncbi:MAG: T9SS type A sorting domain-containing protein [Bacteroidota bacterium]
MKDLLLLSLCCLPLWLNGQFLDSTNYITAQLPRTEFLNTADLDGDGLTDVIFGSETFNHLSWAKNLGGGYNWSTVQLIDDEADKISQAHPVDLNGDGHLDLLAGGVALSSNFWIAWYENDGTGHFKDPIQIDFQETPGTGGREISLYYGDIDGDGDQDFAAAYKYFDKISWYRNEDGLGQFSSEIVVSLDIVDPGNIRLGNFTADGFPDLAVTSDIGNNIVLFENANGLTFNSPDTIASSTLGVTRIEFGDLDNDNDQDILAHIKENYELVWFENLDNAGHFSTKKVIHKPTNHTVEIVISDLDQDMDMDVIFRSKFQSELGICRNVNGAGNFSAPEIIYSANNSSGLATVILDMNDDQQLDILLANGNIGGNNIFLENENNDFSDAGYFDPSPIWIGQDDIKFHDFNYDGFLDLLIIADFPYNITWMPFNPQHNVFEKARIIEGTYNVFGEVLEIADLNEDGFSDIAYVTYDPDLIVWRLNDGNGNFSGAETMTYLNGWGRKIIFSDLDGDGFKDMVVGGALTSSSADSTELMWYKKQGANASFDAGEVLFWGNSIIDLFAADLDQDGLDDLVFSTPHGFPDATLRWKRNLGSGAYASSEVLLTNLDAHNRIIPADINKDDLMDIIIWQESHVAYAINLGLATFQTKSINEFSYPINGHLYDYDLDGYLDLLYATDEHDNHHLYWNRYEPSTDEFKGYAIADNSADFDEAFIMKDMDSDGALDMVVGMDGAYVWKQNQFRCFKIHAAAFNDLNMDGQYSPDEPLLNGFQFELDQDAVLFTSANGTVVQFGVLEDRSYQVTSLPAPDWSLTSDSSTYTLSVDANSTATAYFGYRPESVDRASELNLASGPTRCSFTVPFWLNLSNVGTTTESGILELQADALTTFISAAPAPDSIAGNHYFWEIDSLFPTYQNSITSLFEIADFSNSGSVIEINANYHSLQPDGSLLLTDSTTYYSSITCSYDPNDKLVFPPGVHAEHYTLIGEALEYTVRFQNTGNDTAFNVRIEDYLDTDLNWSTFRVIASSHPATTTINESNGLVIFNFENILLPDSIVNEPLSHGYITYQISHLPHLPENTLIENFAEIYFDFNPAIVTNTTFNTMVSEIPVIIGQADFVEKIITSVYPNPFNDNFVLRLSDNLIANKIEVELFDILGKKIDCDLIFQNREITIRPHQPSSGILLGQLRYRGETHSFKIIRH